ncbi:hypothetical protein A3A84_01865 [Candidatus Collierbacteria bacterium RIFCSPLOWO2_01_FULL_50_23]|uniref:DUF4446 domain-containing protein n=1 Tax=Candidatus Collierbacteria bacterium RIFCSPHIGHO2_01_FULL_50_25 TaxID=1817722 RepID=A0A1F5EY13_9BACT|nr:MAG: hypothetical protein A2703_00155 [Candidatus Collierbacteria bacterium RIFCSPHIGHO2_01_FULL_50_25]OGD74141.1 MAG: hypothetical protein A3A84_01865 [Candidatus Collierbacteria bacterium RIFCSPLOWO2_01_FULL_50_23]
MPGSTALYIILGLLSIWLLLVTTLLVRIMVHYQALTKGVAQKDLISALNNFISKTGQNHEAIENLRKEFLDEKKASMLHFQRLGFRRFNPFTDTGGDQSFILSLLDENGTGVVVSSLHSRENTRVYAKQIENGHCPDQVLSKEEQAVIKDSLK